MCRNMTSLGSAESSISYPSKMEKISTVEDTPCHLRLVWLVHLVTAERICLERTTELCVEVFFSDEQPGGNDHAYQYTIP